ncbi:MAG TPA: hypothetical protein VFR81_29530 [Longimicrobium sp.]|nr:hypothetical protein [Longimicrobium sp.]
MRVSPIPRLGCLAAALSILACGKPAAPADVPAPAPSPAPLPVETAAPPAGQPVEICVLKDGEIATVAGTYFPETGDTLVEGRPWREALPADSPYVAGAGWYVTGEMLPIPGREYPLEKYGLSRILAPGELQRYGTSHRGAPLFVEAGDTSEVADIVYVFVRPGCEFQTYMQVYSVGGVRGR